GYTDQNQALGLELKEPEVAPYFGSQWWKELASAAMAGSDGAKKKIGANGVIGVATGLVGLDGVHGAHTELHPVYIMAFRLSQQAVAGGVQEEWAFLARNSGDEGMCSSHVHYWTGAHMPPSDTQHYFVQLPWPAGASSATVTIEQAYSWEGAPA